MGVKVNQASIDLSHMNMSIEVLKFSYDFATYSMA